MTPRQLYFVSGTNCIGKTQWMIRHFGAGVPEGEFGVIDPKQNIVWNDTIFHVALKTVASTQRFHRYNAEQKQVSTELENLFSQIERMKEDMQKKQSFLEQYQRNDKAILKILNQSRDNWGFFREELLSPETRLRLVQLREQRNMLESKISPYTDQMVVKKEHQIRRLEKAFLRCQEKIGRFLCNKVCDIFLEISCHGDQMVIQLHNIINFIAYNHVHVRNFFINGGVGWNIVQNIQLKRQYLIPNFTTHTYDEYYYTIPQAEAVYIENRTDATALSIEPIDTLHF